MRELKFRVWDKDKKKMVYFNLYNITKRTLHYDTSTFPQYENFWKKKNVEIMQYTGLSDKNGVEIYEGDILSFVSVESPKFRKPYKPFSVYWDEKEARFSDWTPRGNAIVIGNIYANPELMEAKP